MGIGFETDAVVCFHQRDFRQSFAGQIDGVKFMSGKLAAQCDFCLSFAQHVRQTAALEPECHCPAAEFSLAVLDISQMQ